MGRLNTKKKSAKLYYAVIHENSREHYLNDDLIGSLSPLSQLFLKEMQLYHKFKSMRGRITNKELATVAGDKHHVGKRGINLANRIIENNSRNIGRCIIASLNFKDDHCSKCKGINRDKSLHHANLMLEYLIQISDKRTKIPILMQPLLANYELRTLGDTAKNFLKENEAIRDKLDDAAIYLVECVAKIATISMNATPDCPWSIIRKQIKLCDYILEFDKDIADLLKQIRED